jgi:hypothetical protein
MPLHLSSRFCSQTHTQTQTHKRTRDKHRHRLRHRHTNARAPTCQQDPFSSLFRTHRKPAECLPRVCRFVLLSNKGRSQSEYIGSPGDNFGQFMCMHVLKIVCIPDPVYQILWGRFRAMFVCAYVCIYSGICVYQIA